MGTRDQGHSALIMWGSGLAIDPNHRLDSTTTTNLNYNHQTLKCACQHVRLGGTGHRREVGNTGGRKLTLVMGLAMVKELCLKLNYQ